MNQMRGNNIHAGMAPPEASDLILTRYRYLMHQVYRYLTSSNANSKTYCGEITVSSPFFSALNLEPHVVEDAITHVKPCDK